VREYRTEDPGVCTKPGARDPPLEMEQSRLDVPRRRAGSKEARVYGHAKSTFSATGYIASRAFRRASSLCTPKTTAGCETR
jgi:hypothetical protein